METFAERYTDQIRGVISCFDRVIVNGSLPNIRHSGAMAAYLTAMGLKLFEYTTFVNKLRNELRENAQKIAEKAGLEIVFIRKLDDFRKEARIKEIVEERGDHPGLVHIFSAMERCTAFKPWHDKSTGRTTLKVTDGKCLHDDFYFIDKELGLCYLRVPTWAPFRLQFYFNGHNWLARKLDENGFAFNLVDNAFIDISDFEQAQDIADSFNVRRLHRILDRYASMCCPVVKQFRVGVEWTIMQIEYATDIVFRNRESLQRLYEPLIRTAVNAIKADDVARFLGRKQVHRNFKGELDTNFGTRIEGTRLKHRMARSSREHAITGLRNRDIQRHLGLSGSQVSRLLKRLRLHGLLKKVPRRHKYYLTALGRRLIACCLRMREEMVVPALALQA